MKKQHSTEAVLASFCTYHQTGPIVQYVTQGLSAFMKEPTHAAWKAVKHVCRYLQGTAYDGLKMDEVQKGRSMLNVNGSAGDEDEKEEHLMEVICDADYAGNKATRKSLNSVQNLLGWKSGRVICSRTALCGTQLRRV